MWNNLIIENLHPLSIFFKEYEIIKEIEPEEAEEIPAVEVEEALPVEGIQSPSLEAAPHLSFIIIMCRFFLLSHFSHMCLCVVGHLYIVDSVILPLLCSGNYFLSFNSKYNLKII